MQPLFTSKWNGYDYDYLLYGTPVKKKKVLSICACKNETYDESGICSVCQAEARFLGLYGEQVKLYSESKTTIESHFVSRILSLKKRIEKGENLFELTEVSC